VLVFAEDGAAGFGSEDDSDEEEDNDSKTPTYLKPKALHDLKNGGGYR